MNPTCVNSLGKNVDLSRRRLTGGFKSLFGETIYGYVQRYRMEKARELLQYPRLDVRLISELVGYHDPGSFRRVFQQHFGVLPNKYKTGLSN